MGAIKNSPACNLAYSPELFSDRQQYQESVQTLLQDLKSSPLASDT